MTTPRETVEATLPVSSVTLFEDRGRVVRQGTVELPKGLVRVRVAGVAPVLSDRSLYAIAESKGARVVHARVVRRFVPAGTGRATSDGLVPEREQLQRRIGELAETIRVLEGHAAATDSLADRTLREMSEDASAGSEDPAAWDAALDRVAETERGLVRRIVGLRQEMEQLQAEAARLQERIAAASTPAHEHWAAVEMSVEVEEAGPHELRIGYIVPGACWRPYHTARLEGARILFRTDACVWQRTGEDWKAVRLEFSTHRPSQGLAPPELTTDLLATRKRPETVMVESRDQEIATTGLGVAKGATAGELPGIDDRGDVVSLTARTRSTVPSDGRPYRVELFAFDDQAELSLIAMPERATAVVLRSVQTNTAASPILAGPVDLIREGGLAGRTSLLFVAPGESFPLGWGPEGELRLHREVEETREAPRLLSAWELRHHRVTDRLSNVGARPLTVQVVERVPVSEVEKVVVQPDAKATTDTAAPDADGFVRWTAALPAHGRKTLELKYLLKRHQDVTGI